jgi:eukaryotic-like serine/threonine-protein kinase
VESAPIHSVDDLVGRRLAERYSLEAIIGRGGMSVVFRGQDSNLRRPVAVKVFSDELEGTAKKLTYHHFVQEAFALSRLAHPNTLRIYDFGIIEHPDLHAPFQVSELLDGGTLRDLVRKKGPQTIEDAVYLLEGICGALSEAHSQNIIHRDVKPTNILFGRAGTQRIVKLSDFSVAQSEADSGSAFYSLGWSAPEQIRGEAVDVTADIYSLGLVLAYVVSGERLQHRREVTDFYLERERLDGAIDRMLEKAEMPSPLREVVRTACRARRDDRFQNVESFFASLEQAARDHRHVRPSPWMEMSPVPMTESERSTSKTLLVIDDLGREHMVLAGRRFRIFEVSEVFDHEIEARLHAKAARIRLTFLPSEGSTRIHLRGLNCFVKKPNGAMTAGVEFVEDGPIELVGTDRSSITGAHVNVASRGETHWMLALGEHRVAIPIGRASALACLEVVPGGEAHLFFRP